MIEVPGLFCAEIGNTRFLVEPFLAGLAFFPVFIGFGLAVIATIKGRKP